MPEKRISLKWIDPVYLSEHLDVVKYNIKALETNWDVLASLYGADAKQAAQDAKIKIDLASMDLENWDKTRGLYVNLSTRVRGLIREFKKHKRSASKKFPGLTSKDFIEFKDLDRI